VVRCRRGHRLCTTIWIPGDWRQAIRLGRDRWQRCPRGQARDGGDPVKEADLTDEHPLAEQGHGIRIPRRPARPSSSGDVDAHDTKVIGGRRAGDKRVK